MSYWKFIGFSVGVFTFFKLSKNLTFKATEMTPHNLIIHKSQFEHFELDIQNLEIIKSIIIMCKFQKDWVKISAFLPFSKDNILSLKVFRFQNSFIYQNNTHSFLTSILDHSIEYVLFLR